MLQTWTSCSNQPRTGDAFVPVGPVNIEGVGCCSGQLKSAGDYPGSRWIKVERKALWIGQYMGTLISKSTAMDRNNALTQFIVDIYMNSFCNHGEHSYKQEY